jgi:D-tyrosyl-tRNA(Tyr) deacylase
MLALIQRVSHANVVVEGNTVGKIDHGILVFLGVEKEDSKSHADKLLQKILQYRIFDDSDGKMNLNVQQAEGGVLIVSQFTLAADTNKGLRPSFSSAGEPKMANELYEYFVLKAKEQNDKVATGIFQANMAVSLCNDGPVTFLLKA